MTGRRPTDAGATGPLTRPNTVSPFHPEPRRRPLGASLSPAERLVAYEARIRELNAAIDQLGEAVERLETAPNEYRREIAWQQVHTIWVELEDLHNRPFRRPRP